MEKAEERVVSNIVKIRTIRNITKRAMADSIGVGEVTYARIENGTIALSYDYLSRIASSFNMRAQSLPLQTTLYTDLASIPIRQPKLLV